MRLSRPPERVNRALAGSNPALLPVAEPVSEPVAEPVVDSKELDEAKVKIADTENEVKELKATIADLQKSLEGVKVVDVKETVPTKVEPVVDFLGAKTGTPAGSTSISLKDKFKI